MIPDKRYGDGKLAAVEAVRALTEKGEGSWYPDRRGENLFTKIFPSSLTETFFCVE